MDPFIAFIMLVGSIVQFDKMNTLKVENAVLEEKVDTLKYATENIYKVHDEDFTRMAVTTSAATARRSHDINVNKINIEILNSEMDYILERLKKE
tara:strand:- start:1254 stop:1538 length:285 start_codon:yes stop_codon:yes gene_type:complete